MSPNRARTAAIITARAQHQRLDVLTRDTPFGIKGRTGDVRRLAAKLDYFTIITPFMMTQWPGKVQM